MPKRKPKRAHAKAQLDDSARNDLSSEIVDKKDYMNRKKDYQNSIADLAAEKKFLSQFTLYDEKLANVFEFLNFNKHIPGAEDLAKKFLQASNQENWMLKVSELQKLESNKLFPEMQSSFSVLTASANMMGAKIKRIAELEDRIQKQAEQIQKYDAKHTESKSRKNKNPVRDALRQQVHKLNSKLGKSMRFFQDHSIDLGAKQRNLEQNKKNEQQHLLALHRKK